MIIRHMFESKNIFSTYLTFIYKSVELAHMKNKSLILLNTVVYIFDKIKAIFFANNVLALNISGVNFCKNINLSFNVYRQSLHNYSISNNCSLTIVSKSNSMNMSLKSISFTCDNIANGEVPTQRVRVNIRSPYKEPVSQNLLSQLISGLNPICKEMNKVPNNKSIENIAREKDTIKKNGDDKVEDSVFNSHPINLGCSYWKPRQRTLSEHSDGIYFLEDESSNTQNCEQYSAYNDDEDSDDSEDDTYTKIKLNKSEEFLGNANTSLNISKDARNSKRVRFNLNPEIHTMYAWSYAYKSARKGHWESLARDRDRFRKRIENTSKYINPILAPEHRSFIYNSRFDKEIEKV